MNREVTLVGRNIMEARKNITKKHMRTARQESIRSTDKKKENKS